MQAEADKPTMLGRFMSWFKSLGEEEQPKAKPVASKHATRRVPNAASVPKVQEASVVSAAVRGERGERNEGGNKSRSQ